MKLQSRARLKIIQIQLPEKAKEIEEFQNKIKIYASENEQLKQQIHEFDQKMAKEFLNKVNGYATLNFDLQMELKAEKSETEKLKQKNLELERRIALLHNADKISEFVHEDHNTTVKQEFIKTEIKTESEN